MRCAAHGTDPSFHRSPSSGTSLSCRSLYPLPRSPVHRSPSPATPSPISRFFLVSAPLDPGSPRHGDDRWRLRTSRSPSIVPTRAPLRSRPEWARFPVGSGAVSGVCRATALGLQRFYSAVAALHSAPDLHSAPKISVPRRGDRRWRLESRESPSIVTTRSEQVEHPRMRRMRRVPRVPRIGLGSGESSGLGMKLRAAHDSRPTTPTHGSGRDASAWATDRLRIGVCSRSVTQDGD